MVTHKSEQEPKELRGPWHHAAHSGSRSGLDDYNDGATYTHYLGNDEYREVPADLDSEATKSLTGKEAYGNQLEEEIDFKSSEKRHSGL